MKLDKSDPRCKITTQVHEIIVHGTLNGLTRRFCAASAGIDDTTLYGWLKDGREHLENGKDTPYANLARDVAKAEHENAARLMRLIEDAAVKDWKAASWILERRYKDDYGKKFEIHNHHAGSIDTMSGDATKERIKELTKK